MQDSRTKTYRLNFCKRAKLPRFFLDTMKNLGGAQVLDFGCGKDAYWVKEFRSLGFSCDGYDLSRIDVPNKFGVYGYDFIIASNVLNVQENMEQLEATLSTIDYHAPRGGMWSLWWNYPQAPRKMDLTKEELLYKVEQHFEKDGRMTISHEHKHNIVETLITKCLL